MPSYSTPPAREAFTTGLNTAAGVGAVLFIALALLAVNMFRPVGSYGGAQRPETGAPDGVAAATPAPAVET